MTKTKATADVVIRPDRKHVRAAKRLLTAVADAEDKAEAERRFERFLGFAEKSVELTEAAFAAAQELRDLETIDPGEAAWVFESLFDLRQEEYEANDPIHREQLQAYLRLADSEAILESEHARFMAAMTQRLHELQAAFHRARGETALADLMLNKPDEYGELWAVGSFTLVEDRVSAYEGIEPEADPTRVARISERIIALAASETGRETYREWLALCDTARDEDPASAVAAVESVRELGMLSFGEAVELIDLVLGGVFMSAIDADRECARLRSAMTAVERSHGLDKGKSFPEGKEPFEWKYLDHRLERRANRVMATCLRRFGEHRIANLLVEAPEEFERLANETGIGAWARDRADSAE